MKKDMTYDEFEAMCQRFEASENKCDDWFPSLTEIKERIEPDIRNKLEFAIWIDVTANPPVTEEENVARQYLRRLIYKNLKFKENREEKQSN